MLEFVRVVKAKEQVVAGTLHHLVVEAIDGGKKKLYEAKVWVKPWLNFKQVQEFKHAGDPETVSGTPSFTSSDLGVKQGDLFTDHFFFMVVDMNLECVILSGL